LKTVVLRGTGGSNPSRSVRDYFRVSSLSVVSVRTASVKVNPIKKDGFLLPKSKWWKDAQIGASPVLLLFSKADF